MRYILYFLSFFVCLTAYSQKNINNAFQEKTRTELNEITQVILAELHKHFHSNDKDEELQKAKKDEIEKIKREIEAWIGW